MYPKEGDWPVGTKTQLRQWGGVKWTCPLWCLPLGVDIRKATRIELDFTRQWAILRTPGFVADRDGYNWWKAYVGLLNEWIAKFTPVEPVLKWKSRDDIIAARDREMAVEIATCTHALNKAIQNGVPPVTAWWAYHATLDPIMANLTRKWQMHLDNWDKTHKA
jgi:hypothetical protein